MSLRAYQKQNTRDRFIDSAIEVFSAEGFENTTIAKITKNAGANRSTFYLHFKDKIALTIALNDRLLETSKDTLDPLNHMENPSHSELVDWLNQFSEIWLKQQALFSAMMHAQFSEPLVARNYFEFKAARLKGYLERVPNGQRDKARINLQLFLMQLETFFYTKINQHFSTPSNAEIEALADSALFLLYNPSERKPIPWTHSTFANT